MNLYSVLLTIHIIFSFSPPSLSQKCLLNGNELPSNFDQFLSNFQSWCANKRDIQVARMLDEEDFSQYVNEARCFQMHLLSIFNKDHLSSIQLVSYHVLNESLTRFIRGYEFRMYSLFGQINNMEGPHIVVPRAFTKTITSKNGNDFGEQQENETNLADYLDDIQFCTTWFRQIITLMKISLKNNIVSYSTTIDKIVPNLKKLIDTGKNGESIFLHPISTANQSNLVKWGFTRTKSFNQSINVVETEVKNLINFLEEDYIPRSKSLRVLPGISSTKPLGREMYLECLRHYLSLDVNESTPDYIHSVGMEETRKIKEKMIALIRRHGFNGTISDFLHVLQNSSEFIMKKENVLREYENVVFNRIQPRIDEHHAFSAKPNGQLNVREMSFDGPAGFYYPPHARNPNGTFEVNLFREANMLTYGMMTLALHETMPGHHFQFSYQYESKKLPDFRKVPITIFDEYLAVPFSIPKFEANREGWALYSEYLGEKQDLDLFKDDYELLGYYSDGLLRSMRLVVDTGIHWKNWTRQKAIDYMVHDVKDTLTGIEIEVDRYIAWPGQALTYKIGELQIKQFRKTAEDILKNEFDLCQFHALILELGPLPLPLLESSVNRMITDILNGETAPYPRCESNGRSSPHIIPLLHITVSVLPSIFEIMWYFLS